jgi:hypothetical protein
MSPMRLAAVFLVAALIGCGAAPPVSVDAGADLLPPPADQAGFPSGTADGADRLRLRVRLVDGLRRLRSGRAAGSPRVLQLPRGVLLLAALRRGSAGMLGGVRMHVYQPRQRERLPGSGLLLR